MKNDAAQDIVSALDTLLDTEREALITGEIDTLPGLLEEKTRLVEALKERAYEDSGDIGNLRDKFERNQSLLDGTLQGIRTAASRLATLRSLKQSFDTYDESGRRQTIDGDVVHRVEKRA